MKIARLEGGAVSKIVLGAAYGAVAKTVVDAGVAHAGAVANEVPAALRLIATHWEAFEQYCAEAYSSSPGAIQMLNWLRAVIARLRGQ